VDFKAGNKICSFCGRRGGGDTKLAGGLGAMICLDCVEYFHTVSQSTERVTAMTRPPWNEMSDTELLVKLPLILQSADQNMKFAREWVDLIRSRKVSWAAIGNALGVSRQSAWERFGGGREADADDDTEAQAN
jgi:hypothetical protein